MKFVFLILSITWSFYHFEVVHSGCVNARCQWEPWGSFQPCTRTCGGGRTSRERMLCCRSGIPIQECKAECGRTSSGFYDYASCNEHCVHGSYSGSGCICGDKYYGYCCEHEITCGPPSDISHATYTGSSFLVGDQIQYQCNDDYNMTQGDSIHICTRLYYSYGYWDGDIPYCAYVKSCESQPCQNGGVCIDEPDAYSCKCDFGWSGTNCEFDILPPSLENCPKDQTKNTAEYRLFINWTEPRFWDPRDTEILVSANHPEHGGMFPWGRHVVQYVADKLSNGLRTECTFTVTVLPHPCSPLPPPVNGAYACNGWNAEYTQVCTLFCEAGFDVPLGVDVNTLFVCGAAGNWIPPPFNTGCPAEVQHTEMGSHVYTGTCSESADEIGSAYIDILSQSDLSNLCTADEWADTCKPENVTLIC